ncbi:MAG: hypothetical protein ACK456_13910 [Pseudanabaenaceae cyanobacterium]|jgi:hypothetical protein
MNGTEFLTLEEAHLIDAALLSSMEKFMTRITVSSWRILNHIAEVYNVPTQELTAIQVIQWMEEDAQVRREKGASASFLPWGDSENDLDFPDQRHDEVTNANLSSHEKFLARMVIAARKVLLPIIDDYGGSGASLTVQQIVNWIEADCKKRRQEGNEAAFLQW